MQFAEINEAVLSAYFEKLDPLVRSGTELFVFGGAAIALLGAKIRTTVDIDVAAPYSKIDMASFRKASADAGLPVNPPPGFQGAYLEIVEGFMLSMPVPESESSCRMLFKGLNLSVKSGSPADLAASKLIRYSDKDRADVQFLVEAAGATVAAVEDSVRRLPSRIRDDAVFRENLGNFKRDCAMWGAGS